MRRKDPALMNKIRDYAEKFYLERGRAPSSAEIGAAVGVSKATAYRYLLDMARRGMVEYRAGVLSTEKTRRASLRACPARVFLEGIPCGEPEQVDSAVDEVVPLPEALFGGGELYVLRARGDSMIGAGIEDGDLVVVDAGADAGEGDIVVAMNGEGENTLKTLRRTPGGRYFLHPENPALRDIYVSELAVQGVARFVIKKLGV